MEMFRSKICALHNNRTGSWDYDNFVKNLQKI